MYNYLKLLFAVCILVIPRTLLSAEVSKEEMEAVITDDLSHPYLFFSASDKPAIVKRIEDDQECNNIFRRLIAEANRQLHTPVEPFKPVEEEGFYSARLPYLRTHRNAARNLAFVYQMTGDLRYAEKAFEFADAVCDVSNWVNGYHQFPVIYTRVWPWNVPDDQVNFSVDLEAAHTAFSLALVYDWLYPTLEKHQRDRIRGAILEKVITRVRGNYEYHWWSTAYRCNWCSVCNSYIGCSAIALLTEDPQLIEVVAESYNRISKTLDELGVDGGWQEGCSYWNYMLRTSIEFADALKQVTNGNYNLFAHQKIKNNPIDFILYNSIPTQMTVNFGDSNNRLIGQTFFYNKIADEISCSEAAWFRENLFGAGTTIFDILWPRSTVKSVLPSTASHHFRTIDWVVMRSDFNNPDNVLVAAKAGFHTDPHHGHLDCGNFVLYWKGEGFISEMGRGSYDERYFQESRWEFPQASSQGHNVVFVNGENQIPAKHKDEPWLEGIGGRILEFRPDDTRDYMFMDLSGAYPGKELIGWRRHLILEKPVITVVLDEISALKGSEIEVRFHSKTIQRARDRYLLLDGKKGDMALIPVVEGSYSFRANKHPVMEASGLTGRLAKFRWEPYCSVVVTAQDDYTVIATVILPVSGEDEALEIVDSISRNSDRSGNVILSFSSNGRIYTYSFRKGADGLILSSSTSTIQ